MLQSLTISNYLFIENLHLDFHSGLTVLTGETGAGKSILLDALNYVLGHKKTAGISSSHNTAITASFTFPSMLPEKLKTVLEKFGIDATQEIVLSRGAIGKGDFFLNHKKVSTLILKHIRPYLMDIHGQFDHLFSPSVHREILDRLNKHSAIKKKLHDSYKIWKEREETLEALKEKIEVLSKEKEWLEHSIKEFQHLAPQPQEEKNLLEKRMAFMDGAKINELWKSLETSIGINSSLETGLQSVLRLLHKHPMTDQQESLKMVQQKVEHMMDSLIFIHQHMDQAKASSGISDHDRIDDIESRLFALRDMARKHQCPVDSLNDFFEEIQNKLAFINTGSFSIVQLEKETVELKKSYVKIAEDLSRMRKKAAQDLTQKIQHILIPLKLPHTQFSVHFELLDEKNWTSEGTERIEFWVSLNPGIAPGPLKDVASGGECSRLMLALKVILNDENEMKTLIFDEIDMGLGGGVAAAMGKYLKQLSKETQVISITHSPALSAYGDHHLFVEKTSTISKTTTSVQYLYEEDARVKELARMLSGTEITEQSVAAAKELRKGSLRDKIL